MTHECIKASPHERGERKEEKKALRLNLKLNENHEGAWGKPQRGNSRDNKWLRQGHSSLEIGRESCPEAAAAVKT